jgi:hypothetical protein
MQQPGSVLPTGGCQRVPLIEDVMGVTDEEDYALE